MSSLKYIPPLRLPSLSPLHHLLLPLPPTPSLPLLLSGCCLLNDLYLLRRNYQPKNVYYHLHNGRTQLDTCTATVTLGSPIYRPLLLSFLLSSHPFLPFILPSLTLLPHT